MGCVTSAVAPVPGPILAECTALLAELREQYAGDPWGEYHRLARLALEREQLVSYAYRDDILGRRLDGLIAPVEVIEVMRHAFTQVWRDEEAHTALIRGTLVAGAGDAPGLARTTIEQTAGWLAGWSSALKHHVPRSAAPLRSVLVDGLAQAARVVGKLSPDLREELKHKSFKEFCIYNVDAEETAEMCWDRIIELELELDGANIADFQRIAREEREHLLVFAAVAEVLDEHDWLRRGTTAASLGATLHEIGARFAPPAFRPHRAATFGSGADVHVIDDSMHSRSGAVSAALDLLDEVDGETVAINTSWMMGYSVRDTTSIIDPELLRLIVGELQAHGAQVVVLDGPNLYSDIFDNRSVHQVAEHFSIDPGCPIVDATADVVEMGPEPMLGPSHLSRVWVEADVRISLVRLRSHPREHVHGCTANLESLIPGASQNVFWQRRFDHSVAALATAIVAPPHLSILDAWQNCPDGLFGLMAGRHNVDPKRLYVSTDALSCDLIALRHTGSARVVHSPTLRRAIEWFGDPRPHINVVGNDTQIDGWRYPYSNIFTGFLADLSYPVFAYLSGSGALFAPEMDDAFTEARPLPPPLRAIRRIARVLLGLRPPKQQ